MENTKSQKKSYSTASSKSRARRKTKTDYYDYSLVAVIVLLTCFGLIMLYSTSSYMAQINYGSDMYFFKKQAIISVACIIMALIISRLNYRILNRFSTALYVAALVLMALVKTPLGQSSHGAQRWLNLGPLSFQPSEFAKVAVILFLAWQIERTKKATRGFGFMCRTILTLLPIIGLVGSNNLSTAIIILGIGGILIFVSNPGYLEFIGLGSAGAGFIAVFLAAESYRLERLAIWRNPEKYEKGFQTIQGLYAIGSGGIFGRGFGNSLQKLGFVPEAQNDMIFSIICEEMGAAGAIFLIFLFAMLLWRLGVAAMHAKDLAGALICCGIMGHLALQVILNIAVVTNTIPNTGITLPFISYGGTSAVFLLGEMGLAMNVGKCDRIN